MDSHPTCADKRLSCSTPLNFSSVLVTSMEKPSSHKSELAKGGPQQPEAARRRTWTTSSGCTRERKSCEAVSICRAAQAPHPLNRPGPCFHSSQPGAGSWSICNSPLICQPHQTQTQRYLPRPSSWQKAPEEFTHFHSHPARRMLLWNFPECSQVRKPSTEDRVGVK